MADLYKQHKSKNWYMRYTDEQGKDVRRSTGTASRSAAQMILAKELKALELRRMGIGAASPMRLHSPIKEIVKQYIRSIESDGIRPSWSNPIRQRLARMVADMRWHSLADITTDQLKAYIVDHPTAKAHQTKQHYITAVRGLCNWAMNQSPPMLSHNPALHASPKLTRRNANIHEHRQTRRPLWTHEIPMLLNSRPESPREQIGWDRRRKPMYIVALGTGFRRGTLQNLTGDSIHLDVANPHIVVPAQITKSGRQFIMPVEDSAVIDAIDQLLRFAYTRKPGFKHYGRPFAMLPVSETFDRDLARSDIPKTDELGRSVVFHSLRGTFCTQMALSGVPVQVAKELMDHQSISTTMKYYTLVGVVDSRQFLGRMPSLGSGSVGMTKTMPRL